MVYKQFASIYDELMSHAPYDKWTKFTEDIMEQYNIPVQTIVDLGCGTGELTIRLSKLGYNMIGIDQSNEMLTIAANKALEHSLNIQWLEQDIRKLSGLEDIDLIVSYCDVINYITDSDDVKQVFKRVYNSLKQNGLFIFDFHSIYYAVQNLIGHTYADVSDELTYIWECEQGDREGEMFHYLTFFQSDNGHYIRFDEVHHQQTYPVHHYQTLLESCGFRKINFYGDFNLENQFSEENSERIFGVAQK